MITLKSFNKKDYLFVLLYHSLFLLLKFRFYSMLSQFYPLFPLRKNKVIIKVDWIWNKLPVRFWHWDTKLFKNHVESFTLIFCTHDTKKIHISQTGFEPTTIWLQSSDLTTTNNSDFFRFYCNILLCSNTCFRSSTCLNFLFVWLIHIFTIRV